MNEKLQKKIEIFLQKNVCLRCCLFGLVSCSSEKIDENLLLEESEKIEKELSIVDEFKLKNVETCFVCNNYLTDNFLFSTVEKECKYIEKSFREYDNYETFKINLFNLKGIIENFYKILFFFMREFEKKSEYEIEKSESYYKDKYKKHFKNVYIEMIEKYMGIKFDVNSLFNVNVKLGKCFEEKKRQRRKKEKREDEKKKMGRITFKIEGYNDLMFFSGKYLKFARGLTHSPMRGYKSSVESEINRVLKKNLQTNKMKFASSGREDKDVRMLIDGRPFCFKIFDSKKTKVDLEKLVEEINRGTEKVSISSVSFSSDKKLYSKVNSSVGKKKIYRCVVYTKDLITNEICDKLNSKEMFTINQKTPIRVLKRRTMKIREKIVFSMRVEKINDHYFILDITTSSGTYIKEFVTGDLGRTVPSLGDVMNGNKENTIWILQLDVLSIVI